MSLTSMRRAADDAGAERKPQLFVDTLAGVVGCVQLSAVEFHIWGAPLKHLETPDQVVFDLDPDELVPWEVTVEAARWVRERLETVGLESFVKTSGGKGLHVVAPLRGRQNWERVRGFAQLMARVLQRDAPTCFVIAASKERRRGKIYIDVQRNRRGATTVAPYSTRARPDASVSVPLRWGELSPQKPPDGYDLRSVSRRLSRLRHDPWEGFRELRQSISQRVWSRAERL